MNDWYLGFDSSTQGLKAIVIDPEQGAVVATETVSFGRDLPQYGCPEGYLPNTDPLVRRSSPLMWADALDLVLRRLREKGVPLDRVAAVSGAGQQHGSVYLTAKASAVLPALSPDQPLAEQIESCLSRSEAPIWMDSSTHAECVEIAGAVGPRLQADTGSPAIERFTGPQIRKFWKEDPKAYGRTDRIHLVSSFMASLLIGGHAPIDHGDGAGMNLLNLHSLDWDAEIAEATAPELIRRLPPVLPSAGIAGTLHPYFAQYGLRAGIPVVRWTGDNPSSLVGLGATQPGVAVISLGTSDTVFAAMARMHTDPAGCGHVFGNPAGGFMSLICFKNGSLARERIKEEAGVDWDFFGGRAFRETVPGQDGNLMLPYFIPEITPLALTAGVRRRGSKEFVAGQAGPAAAVRAIVESQALSMRLHSAWIGRFTTLRVTGGASRSPGLLQTLADVFQAKVETIALPDSAALGAALRAAQGAGKRDWDTLYARFTAAVDTVSPNPSTRKIYEQRLKEYAALEREART